MDETSAIAQPEDGGLASLPGDERAESEKHEVLDSVPTPVGTLELRRRIEDGGLTVIEITLAGGMLMSTLCSVSERALASVGLDLHPGRDLRVLVGGLGLGYTAAAVLADPRVAQLTVVDRLPTVIRWMREGLLPLSEKLNGDPRLAIVEGDVYTQVLGTAPADGDCWDLILIDVDHAPSDPLDHASLPFYRWHGQRQVMDHLAPGGIVGIWSSEDDDDFADVVDEVYPDSLREYVRFRHEMIEEGDEIAEVIFFGRCEGGEPGPFCRGRKNRATPPTIR